MDYGLPEQTYNVNPDLGSFEISTWLVYVAWIVAIILILWLIKKIINFLAHNSKHFDHSVYQVKLPKDKPGEKDGQRIGQIFCLQSVLPKSFVLETSWSRALFHWFLLPKS